MPTGQPGTGGLCGKPDCSEPRYSTAGYCYVHQAEVQKRWRQANPAAYRAIVKRANFKRNHNITPEEAEALLEAQGGVCAICGQVPARPCVDHKGKKIRGILCANCNVGIGMLQDDPAILGEAINYLVRNA